MIEDHRYELKYIYGKSEIIARFAADLNVEEMRERLEGFLLGCGWGEVNVNKIFGMAEDVPQ